RARSACTRKPASRSRRISAALDLMSCTRELTPRLSHRKTSSPSASTVRSISLPRRRPIRARGGPQALKELGNDPSGTPIKLMKGRYGPYVTDGSTNATVPDADNAEAVTLEQALALIADRAAKGGTKKKKKAVKPKAEAKPKNEPKPKKEAKAKSDSKAAAAPTKRKAVVKKKPEPVAGE